MLLKLDPQKIASAAISSKFLKFLGIPYQLVIYSALITISPQSISLLIVLLSLEKKSKRLLLQQMINNNHKPKRIRQPLKLKKNLNKQAKLSLKINLIPLKRHKEELLLMNNQIPRKNKNLNKLVMLLKKKRKLKLSILKKKLSHFKLTCFLILKEKLTILWLGMFLKFLQLSTQKNLKLYPNSYLSQKDFPIFSTT